MKKLEFEVVRQSISEEIESNKLSRIQKLICKWFKITPERKNWYSVFITIKEPSMFLAISDIVIDRGGNKWVVTDWYEDGSYRFVNINPLPYCSCHGLMAVISRSFKEGRHE